MPLVDPDAAVEVVVKNGKRFVALPSRVEAEKVVHNTRRKLADLPDITDRMNPISAVIAYQLFGLDNEEIAVALKLTTTQVSQIIATDAYTKMYETVVGNLQKQSMDEVKDVFQQHAKRAAEKIVEHIGSNSALVSHRAAKDALAFAGYSPEQNAQNRMSDGLVIKIYQGEQHGA